jgi:flavin reductase ActVB
MPVRHDELRDAMARVPAPVAVATTVGSAGRRWGFTASSFTSLSLAPPLVLICLHRSASTYQPFTSADHFMINLLSSDQAEVAVRFAERGADRFGGGDMRPCELGLPGLAGAAVRLACARHAVLDGGDHGILVGLVESVWTAERAPLVYWDREFARPARMEVPA